VELTNDSIGAAGTLRRDNARDRQMYIGWLHELETSGPYWKSGLSSSFAGAVTRACAGRRLFVTTRGYFGFGPAELDQGDAIFVLAGGTHCYALRPCVGPRLNIFELAGDCYVHGIMDVEAVADHAPGYKSRRDRLRKLIHGGHPPDPELAKRDFHDIYIV
jgi:hypothetical protein